MRRSRAIACLLLAAALTTTSVTPAFASKSDDLQAHQSNAANARKKAAQAEKMASQLAKDVQKLDGRIDAIQAEVDELDPKIREATSRTQRIQREVDGLTGEIDDTKSQIAKTQAQYTQEQELLAQRVQATYRQGEWFYLEILFGCQDIGDLITRTEFVSRVIDSNNDIAAGLANTQQKLERAKVKLDRSLQAVLLKRKEAQAVENELRGLQAARQSRADQQEAIRQDKAELMADNKANAKRLRALAEQEEAESAKIAAELAAANGSGYFAGSMVWPVPSSHRITSNFGPRICPFHGKELHPGIDVGAPSGTAIVATAAGKVIYAGYRGGYGNTIMIDHGNGVVTLYAHQSGFSVGSGTQVSAGQRIGSVGSTGNSTGPHLHFELRINGTPKNPHSYIGY